MSEKRCESNIAGDKPFTYNLKVTDGQIVNVYLEWQSAMDILAKEREANLKHVDELKQEISRLEKVKANFEKQLDKTQQEAWKIKREYKNMKNGWSFKIGRIITYVPRRIKDYLKK